MPPSSDNKVSTGLVIMGGPSEIEMELVEKFKEQIADILETEEHKSYPFLLRWIRARDGNLEKAEAMIRASFKWRNEQDVDNTMQKPLDSFVAQNYKYHTEAKGFHGHPVREVHVGSWDLRKAIDIGKEEQLQDLLNHFFESILAKLREANEGLKEGEWPRVTDFILIIDWEGYSYSQLMHWKSMQTLLKFGAQYEAHYPEILNRCYFINAPMFLSLFLALLKPILAPKTYNKIKVLGKRSDWEPELKEIIPAERLWKRFGGDRE